MVRVTNYDQIRQSYSDTTGDIALTLNTSDKVAYLHLWPHAKPWRLAHPVPMLRVVPDATQIARTLADALAASAGAVARPNLAPPARYAQPAQQRGALAAINPS